MISYLPKNDIIEKGQKRKLISFHILDYEQWISLYYKGYKEKMLVIMVCVTIENIMT